jgi:predicted NBD/HSP70 family sugar kinase
MLFGPVDNPRTILREIFVRGPSSRSDLAKATGLTGAAISRITRQLLDEGILLEGEKLEVTGKLGRKFVALTFGTDRYVVGIGVQAVSQWVEVANLQGHTVGRRSFAMTSVSDASAVLDRCAAEVEQILGEARIEKSKVFGVGVSVVGVVDIHTGTVIRAENLGWKNVPVTRILGERLGLPVYAENFLNSVMLASNSFAMRTRERHSVLVVVSLGIGASILLNGKVVAGSKFAAGQIGHVRVPGAEGQCTCGRIGCLDTVASGRAILAHFGLLHPHELINSATHKTALELFHDLSARAETAPEVAKGLFDAGRALGDVLGVVTGLLDPETIVLSGMVCEARDYFDGVRHSLSWYSEGSSRQTPALHLLDSSNSSAPTHLAFARFVLSKH